MDHKIPLCKLTVRKLKKHVVPTEIAGNQKPRMTKAFHILVNWIPVIPAGMTAQLKAYEQ
jgi:hypothetical protein